MYIYKCSWYNSTYIGATKRHQKVGFSKHIGSSWRTGKALKSALANASKIKDHILMNQQTGLLDNFTALWMGGDNELIEIKECVMIKTLKLTSYDNRTSKKSFLFNWLIIGHSYSKDENIF